jgi:hypothetical protein
MKVARIVAQVRRRWPHVRILVRADSGFAREELMAWCEANGVHFLCGLAQNNRLVAEIAAELARAEVRRRLSRSRKSGHVSRLRGTNSSPIFRLTPSTLFLDGLAPKYQWPSFR